VNPWGLIHALSAMIAVGFTKLDSKQNKLIRGCEFMKVVMTKVVHFFRIH